VTGFLNRIGAFFTASKFHCPTAFEILGLFTNKGREVPISLTRYRVDRLHGFKDFEIPIQNNRLVIVGENGSGKTTMINLLYLFLSRQWARLANYDFRAVTVQLNEEEFVLTKGHLQAKLRPKPLFKFPMTISRKLRFRRIADDLVLNPDIYDLRATAHQFGVTESALKQWIEESRTPGPERELATEFQQLSKRLGEIINDQILYLPTYRRIEQDLNTIFPNVDLSELHGQLEERQGGTEFVELVEFGMEDVVDNIKRKMGELKDDERNRLTNLTGSYLREVISGEYRDFKVEEIEMLQPEAVDSILNRIAEDILPQNDKDRMRLILREIHSSGQLNFDQQVIAHFLLKLLQVNAALRESEADVRRFTELCNTYLRSTGKEVVFDNNEFKLFVVSHDTTENEGTSNIELRFLSSGEKQIVSVFSHLLLSGIDKAFVLIDEPELSLSVPWQKMFLPDIFHTQQCSGLIAVTHSPFIFQNEFDGYAHSLTEFRERA